MYEVKKVEARRLLHNLKDFAFESNPKFKDGSVSGVEIQKTFWLTDVAPKLGKKTLGFIAHRIYGDGKLYSYLLTSSEERELKFLPDYLKIAFPGKEQKVLEKIATKRKHTLSEVQTTEFDIAENEPKIITISHKYGLLICGSSIHEISEDEMMSSKLLAPIPIPKIESDFDYPKNVCSTAYST